MLILPVSGEVGRRRVSSATLRTHVGVPDGRWRRGGRGRGRCGGRASRGAGAQVEGLLRLRRDRDNGGVGVQFEDGCGCVSDGCGRRRRRRCGVAGRKVLGSQGRQPGLVSAHKGDVSKQREGVVRPRG